MKCIEPVTHGCIGGRAHSAGIVYRDLKPENVMITADGRAKTLTSVSPSRSCPNRPQARDLVTETGMVFGTVPYMSPEQARGEEVDYRSDQFSWGVVIHEMVTGTHPFRGTLAFGRCPRSSQQSHVRSNTCARKCRLHCVGLSSAACPNSRPTGTHQRRTWQAIWHFC